MQTKEKILDDVARMAGGSVSILSGFRGQVKEDIRARLEEAAHRLDLVPREDFERLETMLGQAREEQEALKKRLEALEAQQKKK